MAANLVRTPLLPFGLELVSRQITPSSRQATRILHWSASYLSIPFSLDLPQDDPSLRALHEPYPSVPPNDNVFEVEGVEYASGSISRSVVARNNILETRSISAGRSHTQHSNAQLLKCIHQKDYSGAIALRRDLEALHTTISPRYTYAQVAQYLLDHPNKSDPYAFLQWCELLPSLLQPWSKPISIPPAIDQILSRLLQRPESIESLCRFAILAARKGMARLVAPQIISQVTRYSTPEVASRLLAELINAASVNASHSSLSTIPPKVLRSWNNIFIRTLCLSGRVEAAYQGLLALHNNQRALSPHTYRIVSEELEKIEHRKEGGHVRALAEQAGFPHPRFTARTRTEGTSRTPRDFVSKDLRRIKIRLSTGSRIPTAELINFMKSYRSTGNYRAIPLLRKRLFRGFPSDHQKSTLSAWGTAEMQLYRSEGKHIDTLSIFRDIFLPQGITPQILHELGLPSPPNTRRHPLLWPPSEAISIASWSAAALATSHNDKEALGRCYLYFLESWYPKPTSFFEIPPVMRPDAAAFQPWIGAFARRAGPEAIAKIMRDMKALGVPPTIMTWNALAKAYVSVKEWEIAKSILGKMENSRKEDSTPLSSSTNARLRSRLGPILEWGFPAAELSTYYILLRELLATKQFPAAKELVEIFLQNGHEFDTKLSLLVQKLEKRGMAFV
ncbi:pentatricopeptide repeat-containing protein 5, mitochondrial [Rhizoctonia solani]|uniref:Pentatricopeptide repeat-containing protein 5, mitochondrial n=1 Tax=Rhizoctonia solani TaxID=456999 RepID=A0A8H8NUB5_9AGAM|nr:pentatricopeptide repeat-containing protein 5, mitochondrial [Rhizoctonia solani]QRW18907.1 pentatricopeptide repeat-containing protein 5, mitochondrial [Rhizoctonia solani]